MANRPATDVRFGDLLHRDRSLHSGRYLDLLERILQSQGIHHRGKHPHIVRGSTINAFGTAGNPAPNVAAAANDGHLHAQLYHFLHLLGDGCDRLGVDAVTVLTG
ncbi:hypothetical protein D3C74_281210 [compost metagenome]